MTVYLAAIGLAIGLALDTAVVAAARAVAGRRNLALPWLFGVAHVLMSTIGWLAGRETIATLDRWDHWVVFGVLTFLGARMIFAPPRATDPQPTWEVGVLAIATSIDALAAGVAIDAIGIPPAVAIGLIGGVCVVVSTAAMLLGHRLGHGAGPWLSRLGGGVLIAVAVRIVVLHTS